jgi:hypothetical protein
MTLSQFVAKYDGKGVDWDGAFGYQCMDLYRRYVHDVLDFPQSPPVEGAADVWTTYLTEYFEKVPNTPTGVPEPGDVVIWNRRLGPYGHIAIFISGDANSFVSFDQNFPVGSLCHKQTHSYTNLYGWLRPKKVTMADTVAVESAKFTELVTKSTYWDAVVKLGISQPSDVEDLRRQIKEANAQTNAAQQEAKDTRSALTDFQQQVAEKLNSPQDLARVLSAIQGLLDSEAQAVRNSEKDAFKLKEAEGAILELKAEIARLQLELKANKSLATATMLQMFTEIIERFKRILNGL